MCAIINNVIIHDYIWKCQNYGDRTDLEVARDKMGMVG